MNFNKTFLTKILIIIALAALTYPTFAQTGNSDKILVTGEYSLKQSDIDTLTELYEWLLNTEFTSAQRKRFQTLAVKEAQTDPQKSKVFTAMLSYYKTIKAVDEEKRDQLRQQILPSLVSGLENKKTELNTFLFGIYQNAQDKTADKNAQADDSQIGEPKNTGGAVKVADLAGIWSTSSVSGIRYKSLVTGELSDPSGSIIEYQISPNGNIKHVGYLSSTVYTCTTKLFISRTGRITINGSNITFDFAPGKRMYQTCSASASRNDTLPAEKKTYPFRLERDEYGILQLCTVEENGKNFCIRKKGD